MHDFRLVFLKHSLQSGHEMRHLPRIKSPFSIAAEASIWRRYALRTALFGSYTTGIFTGLGGFLAVVCYIAKEINEAASDEYIEERCAALMRAVLEPLFFQMARVVASNLENAVEGGLLVRVDEAGRLDKVLDQALQELYEEHLIEVREGMVWRLATRAQSSRMMADIECMPKEMMKCLLLQRFGQPGRMFKFHDIQVGWAWLVFDDGIVLPFRLDMVRLNPSTLMSDIFTVEGSSLQYRTE